MGSFTFREDGRNATRRRRPISQSRRNAQLDFRAGTALTPDDELPTELFGALAHTRQAPMPGSLAAIENLGINSLSIVTDSYAKQLVTIPYLRFNVLGLSVNKSVAQGLTQNAVHFIANHGVERLRRAFDHDLKGRRTSARSIDGE